MELSAVTKNRRLYAVQHFLAWGAGDDRWPKKILERIKLARLPQTKTRPRRVLTLDELVLLIDTAEKGDTVAGVSGKQRALMYRTLVSTGLRFGELTRIAGQTS
jgi:integrase